MNRFALILFIVATYLGFSPLYSYATDVLIIADAQLKPVADIVSGIGKALRVPSKIYAPTRVAGRLNAIVAEEEARVVVALGKEALAEALRLPTSVLVIYDLVVIPPTTSRANTTGFFMATPVKNYLELLSRHLPTIRRIAVVGSREQIDVLLHTDSQRARAYSVKTSFELASTVKGLTDADAVLLLPEAHLLTSTAVEESFLFSFRNKIPLLGISEKNVRDGALLALVVDSTEAGRQIGEYVAKALRGDKVGLMPPSPPRKYDLFLNLDTARKMGIRIPDELLRNSKRVYR